MRHLDSETLVGHALEGAGHPHLAACERCREEAAAVRRTAGALELAHHADPPPQALSRWAVAYARCAAPDRPRPRLLALLAASAGPLVEVRAGAAAAAALYGDERFQVDLRLEPDRAGARLHGQVVSVDDPTPAPWQVTAVGAHGVTTTVASDAFGEFRIDGPAARWGVTVIAQRGDDRLVVSRFDGGEELRGSSP